MAKATATDNPRRNGPFGDSADGLFVVDQRGCIVDWNDGSQRLLGYQSAEVLHRPCREVLNALAWDGRPVCAPECRLQASLARGVLPEGVDVCVRAKEGRLLWLHVSVIVHHGESGPLILHVLHDVSRHRRTSELMARVAALCEGNGVAQHDRCAVPALGMSCAPSSEKPLSLTAKEREILRLLARGLSTTAIASSLCVSPHTVRNHVQHLLEKSGAHNRTALVSLAMHAGLLL